MAYRTPIAVVCLLSAAALYELTDEMPLGVQIAVPRGTWRPRIDYPPVEVFQFGTPTFDFEIMKIDAAENELVRVYSPARTVVDLMKFRRQVSETVALIALRRYVSDHRARIGHLMDVARRLDVLGPVSRAVDVLKAS